MNVGDVTVTLRPLRPEQLAEDLHALATIVARFGAAERRKVADRVRLGIARNFTREGPEGWRWAPLAPRTVKERRELGFAGQHPILQRTRELKRSWTERGHPKHQEGWGSYAGMTVLTISSSDPRVQELTEGRAYPPMPERPMHLLDDADTQGIEDTLVWCIETAARRGL
jgi:hypothetical protein